MIHSNKIIIGKVNSGKSTLADKMIQKQKLSKKLSQEPYFQIIQWGNHNYQNSSSQSTIAAIVDRRTTLSSATGELFHSFTETLEEFQELEPHTDRTLIIDDYTSILAGCNNTEKVVIKEKIEHLISIGGSQKKSIWIIAVSSIAKNINLSKSIVSSAHKYLITDETTSDWFDQEWQELNNNTNMLEFIESMQRAYECGKQSKYGKALYSTVNNKWQPF